jgi:predicted N-acetyltransferase YhbS
MSSHGPGPRLEVRQAEPADLAVVAQVLEEASAWLRSRSIDQWSMQFSADWIGPPLARGETWLANIDGAVVGTLTLTTSDPARPDGHVGATYLHRLAVRRSFAGVGRELLEWAVIEARRRGHRLLRLDCVSSNLRLRRYYTEAGFTSRGESTIHGTQVTLFDRRTGPDLER